MRVESPMISYHSLEGGKSDRIMSVDCHPDAALRRTLCLAQETWGSACELKYREE